MNPAVPPTGSAKMWGDVIEFGGKLALSLSALFAFSKLIARPFMAARARARQRRKEAETMLIRNVLSVEIEKLQEICERETTIFDDYIKVVQRQEQIFHDLDILIEIFMDNRDRLDEVNGLLDELGLTSRDRRDRDADIDEKVSGLIERRRARLRRLPLFPITNDIPPRRIPG